TRFQLIFRVIGALTGECEALGLGSGGVDLDLRERLVLGAIHGHLRGQPPGSVRDTPPPRGVKAAHLPGVATFRSWRCDKRWDDAESRNIGRPRHWRLLRRTVSTCPWSAPPAAPGRSCARPGAGAAVRAGGAPRRSRRSG